jgi:hypothetical protein
LGPSSSSEAKSTAYDTDIVEPPRTIGRLTLKTEVTDDSVRSSRKSHGVRSVSTGKHSTTSAAPSAIIPPT